MPLAEKRQEENDVNGRGDSRSEGATDIAESVEDSNKKIGRKWRRIVGHQSKTKVKDLECDTSKRIYDNRCFSGEEDMMIKNIEIIKKTHLDMASFSQDAQAVVTRVAGPTNSALGDKC